MDNFNALVSGVPQPDDLVNDGWTDIIAKLLVRMRQADAPDLSPSGLAATVELADFEADGASTFHGMHSRGFPNLFIFSLIQSGFSVNFPHMLNEQSKHAAYIIRHALELTPLDTFDTLDTLE